MGLLKVADQKKIKAQFIRPSRATAVANANNGLSSVVGTIDVALGSILNHRTNVHVLTIPPNTEGLDLKPKVGDIALVYFVDDERTDNPYGFAIYVYSRPQDPAGAMQAASTLAWRPIRPVV
ncbi:MAG: hypothetical protein LBU70_04955 [Chitinispirillales bacterium]|jgi:hypothetical protein|nr:hypothetical protein [Chitinispirillales bacterium]